MAFKKHKTEEPASTSTMIRKFLSITPRTDDMANEIMAERGHATFSELVRAAIERYHDEIVRTKFYRSKSVPKGTSPSGAKAAAEEAEERNQMLICDELGGNVRTNANGSKVCVYYTFVGKQRYEQELSLSMLDRMMLNNQYTPSKEAVERLQKEGKVDYEI